MRVLILTCNTGGGHNACAKAIQEVFVENGHSCETADAISFVSEKLSKFMDWGPYFRKATLLAFPKDRSP